MCIVSSALLGGQVVRRIAPGSIHERCSDGRQVGGALGRAGREVLGGRGDELRRFEEEYLKRVWTKGGQGSRMKNQGGGGGEGQEGRSWKQGYWRGKGRKKARIQDDEKQCVVFR